MLAKRSFAFSYGESRATPLDSKNNALRGCAELSALHRAERGLGGERGARVGGADGRPQRQRIDFYAEQREPACCAGPYVCSNYFSNFWLI